MRSGTTRNAVHGGRRRVRIVLATFAVMALGWAGIGLDPASLNLDGWRWIVEADSRQPRLVRVFAHDGEIGDIAWSPDGQRIAAGGRLHRALMVWDANTGALLHKLDKEEGSISAVAWSPDGKYVAAGRWFTVATRSHVAINMWHAESGRRIHSLQGPLPIAGGVNDVSSQALKFSPDGRLLVAGHSGAISIHDVESGRLVRTIQGHLPLGRGLALGAGGKQLITAGEYRVSRLQAFDIDTGDKVRAFGGVAEIPLALAASPDGREVASGDHLSPHVTTWDVETGRPARVLEGLTRSVRAVAYSHDGSLLASSSLGGGVLVWKASTGERLLALPQTADHVGAVAFSPDRRYLAAPVHRLVRIWDLAPALPPR